MHKSYYPLILFFTTLILYSCNSENADRVNKDLNFPSKLKEADILEIPLNGEISNSNSEISGLCWFGNKLILLPQFPNSFNADYGKIFFIEKNRLLNFILGKSKEPILPDYLSIDLSDFDEFFGPGSGFEAITTKDNYVYFTIESMNFGKTESLLVMGVIDSINKTISLNKESLTKDPSELFIHNISDESILFHNDKIIPIYEVFGKNKNSNPQVSVFNDKLQFIKKIPFPNIEYRITDVTSVDDTGNFWAINYFYPRDFKKLNPAKDELFLKHGIGKSHINYEQVERLVEFKILEDKIVINDSEPIYIELQENESRNWEGIVRFDDGFIIATDKYPSTILAYLKN